MRIGFRAWNLRMNEEIQKFEFLPIARTHASPWVLGGITESTCELKKHPSPFLNCMCGLYHWYDIQALEGTGQVYGAVQCWGRMIGKGTEGFKAQYGRILAVVEPSLNIFVPPPPPRAPDALVENLYMLEMYKYTLSEFTEFIRRLHSLNTTLPERLHWRMPDTKEVKTLYEEMQREKERVFTLQQEYDTACEEYREAVENYSQKRLDIFLEQMPFPVFKSVQKLREFAGMFGDLGPP